MHLERIPLGLCQCGCGRATEIAQKTNTRAGNKKGQPRRFVQGHWKCKPLRYFEMDCGYATFCWVWQQHCTSQGYARMWWKGRPGVPAYRVYQLGSRSRDQVIG